MDNWHLVRNYLRTLTAVVFVFLAIIGGAAISTARISTDAKTIGQQNRTFLVNFSEYMHCLVVPDEKLYKELGKEAYFTRCDSLLFRNTGIKPPVRTPPESSSTTVIGQ